jgi:membrane protein DedA with SNARE-associated domain
MFTLVSNLIAKTGILGVFLLMVAENLLPVIPSELILPMAGFDAAQGRMNPVLAIIAGGVGSALGGGVWYMVGRWVGIERLRRVAAWAGRWSAVTPRDLDRGEAWFRRRGAWAVAIGRCVPGVRGYICIPAGVARMRVTTFAVASSLGALAWSAILVAAGFALNRQYDRVQHWLDPITEAVVAAFVLLYLVRVATVRTSI